MRGPRETVAKALALECMRAAKAQERGCYVFAFAGPQEVCHHLSTLPFEWAAALCLSAASPLPGIIICEWYLVPKDARTF